MSASISPAILEALAIADLPEVTWTIGDDLCDCTYQRIGMWTNPYLAETQEIRLCCIFSELGKQYPEMVRSIPGFWDENAQTWVTEPREWDGETDMPAYLWYRQMARKEAIPLGEARARYAAATPPCGIPRPEFIDFSPDIIDALFLMIGGLSKRLEALESR
jgi:hypothetical protein